MSIRNLLFNASVASSSTLGTVDIFGDSSGKALYRLEGNALDESGNYNGTATSVTYGTGKFEQCAVFNGSTSGIVIPSSALISPTTDNTSFTVSTWVKFNTLPDATYSKSILGVSSTTSNSAPTAISFKYQSAGVFKLGIIRGYGGYAYYNASDIVSNISLSTGVWYYFTFVYAIGRTVSVFKDGVQIATNVPLSSSVANPVGTNLCIGQYNNSGTYANYAFNGNLDALRIFNRTLTATEVSTLYTEI